MYKLQQSFIRSTNLVILVGSIREMEKGSTDANRSRDSVTMKKVLASLPILRQRSERHRLSGPPEIMENKKKEPGDTNEILREKQTRTVLINLRNQLENTFP